MNDFNDFLFSDNTYNQAWANGVDSTSLMVQNSTVMVLLFIGR